MNAAVHFDRQISQRMPTLIRTDTPSTSPSISRRQPLLQRSLSTLSPRATCSGSTAAEVCGGTTAECAAVWCCCPCGLVNLLVLAVYKVPAGLCRRALRNRRRRKLIKRGLLPPPLPAPGGIRQVQSQTQIQNQNQKQSQSRNRCRCDCREFDFAAVHPLGSGDVSEEEAEEEKDDFLELKIIGKEPEEEDEAVASLEKEMWNRFYGAGFWRSPSQRETVSSPRTARTGLFRGPSGRETVALPSPRTSFTGLYRPALKQ